jgi:hypothetical protein
MEEYELEPDKIINWAVNYASYEDLQTVAKAIYGVYNIRRKKENPAEHYAAKKARRDFRKRGWKK